MKNKLIYKKLINYLIYTIPCLIYGLYGTDGAGTTGILVFPTFIFSILLFFYDLGFTYLGLKIFKNSKLIIVAYLLPQIIGLIIFIFRKYNHKYILDSDTDIILWFLLVLMTLLNSLTYFKFVKRAIKPNKSHEADIHFNSHL